MAGYQYERDPIGNRTRMVASEGEYNYEYDENSQLTKASSPLMDPESFKYDDLGNRVEDATGQYVYDEKRQRLKEDSRFIYSYDDNGNLSGKVSRQDNTSVNYIHNSENRLIKIESFEGATKIKEVKYVYDALGRRVKKEIVDLQDNSNSFTRKYGYDGEEMLFEFNEHNQLMSTFTHSTLRSDDMLAVDFESAAVSEGRAKQTGSLFYLKDALGSVKELVDSSGNVQQKYGYSSFGKLVSVTDATGLDIKDDPIVDPYFSYTGREFDRESRLYYYRARYYSPEIGRFIQTDPDPGKAGSPITTNNKYSYVGNNPLKNIDPSGEEFLSAFVVGAVLGMAMNEVFDMEYSLFQAALLGAAAGYGGAYFATGVANIQTLAILPKILTALGMGATGGALASTGLSLGLGLITQNRTYSDNLDSALGIGLGVGAALGAGYTFFANTLDKAVVGRMNLIPTPLKYATSYTGDVVALSLFSANEFLCSDNVSRDSGGLSCEF